MHTLSGIQISVAFFALAIFTAAVFRQPMLVPVIFVLLLVGRWLLPRRGKPAPSQAAYDQYQVSGDEWDQRSSRKREGRADWQ